MRGMIRLSTLWFACKVMHVVMNVRSIPMIFQSQGKADSRFLGKTSQRTLPPGGGVWSTLTVLIWSLIHRFCSICLYLRVFWLQAASWCRRQGRRSCSPHRLSEGRWPGGGSDVHEVCVRRVADGRANHWGVCGAVRMRRDTAQQASSVRLRYESPPPHVTQESSALSGWTSRAWAST